MALEEVLGYGFDAPDEVRKILEAAAPHMLKDMRHMTRVEIAARDRPEQMDAARAKVREGRKSTSREQLRKAREEAWDRGMSDMVKLMGSGPGYEIANPYGETFAERNDRQSIEAKQAKHAHPVHKEGQWYYACEACSGLPDGDRQ